MAPSASRCDPALAPGSGHAGEAEHPLEEAEIGVGRISANFSSRYLGLVGKTEAGLLHEYQIALGLSGIVVDEELQEPARTTALELAERREQGLDRVDRLRLLDQLLDRLGSSSAWARASSMKFV